MQQSTTKKYLNKAFLLARELRAQLMGLLIFKIAKNSIAERKILDFFIVE